VLVALSASPPLANRYSSASGFSSSSRNQKSTFAPRYEPFAWLAGNATMASFAVTRTGSVPTRRSFQVSS
jgi:hypothetical protein